MASLLQAWSLGEVHSVTEVAGGATNWVCRVEASSGVSFLRLYRKADRRTALREHGLIAYVRQRGIPAPLPVLSLAGETVVEREGQLCALYESASGLQLAAGALSQDQAIAAGDMLAFLHAITRDLPDVGYVRWNLAWDGPAWAERLSVVERAILSCGVSSETDEWALRRLCDQQRWLRDPACLHTYSPAFSRQVTHGDYQHANLFFDGPALSAVIDWEQAAFMPPAYELVRAAAFLFRFDPALTRAFVDAYVDRRRMSTAELLDGARAWACFSDHHVWALEEAYLNGNESAKRYIPHLPFRPFMAAWSEIT